MRLLLASEAKLIGWGGISAVNRETGVSCSIIADGIRELKTGAQKLMITADGEGSNGSRVELWKLELQKFANEAGLDITVCHLPPGTSKWNKIEHRLFSFISQNWRGKPLTSLAVIVSLIAATTARTGLKVKCAIDNSLYPKGIKVNKEEMNKLAIELSDFHGEWNYTIRAKPMLI